MKLTRTIKDAIKEGYSGDFISLLEEFGKWSRYFGCQGYFSEGHVGNSYNLDDTSGAIIDRAFCKLKENNPGIYLIMRMYYINGMKEMQIVRELRRRNLIDDLAARYANTLMVRERLKTGEEFVLRELQNEERLDRD